jgi:formylglycine-generating enzyme required for sulfatase activity
VGFHLYPVGAKEGKERVVRGGGYDDSIDFLRVTFRFAAKPETKSNKIGFRLATDGFE